MKPIAMHVREQAAEWLLQLQENADCPQTCERWRQWRAANAEHERAWRHIENFSERLQQLSSPLAHAALAPRRAISRRQLVKTLAVALFAGGIARYAIEEKPWQPLLAQYRTGTGERRSLTLDDGSVVALNSATAIDVHYSREQRGIALFEGEIRVTTGHGAQAHERPFVVTTAQGSIRALGTQFSVRQLDDAHNRISVFEGAVALQPRAKPAATQLLHAGECCVLRRDGVGAITVADEYSTAWVDGMIVARDMPLADFLAELSRHRPGRLGCDPAIAALPVTGTYPLADTDKVLAALQARLPLRVQRLSRYWVSLHPRDTQAG